MNEYLFTPGPVPVETDVAQSAARNMIAHRGPEFSALFLRIEEKLGRLLRSPGRTVLFPASGTGALESLAVNLTGPDTKVLSVSCGVFGDRFRDIVALTGAQIIPLDIEPGRGATPQTVTEALAANPDCTVLTLTQNETSTGVRNPIGEIVSALPKANRPLVLVDGVSSVGAMPCYPAEWGVDGLAAASQKGLLTPPGLGLVWLSERAWQTAAARKCPSYYFDLIRQKKTLDREAPENPYTPPISLYFALDAALDRILADDWFDRRARAARAFCAGIEALGFHLLAADPTDRSPGVTAFSLPDGDIAAVSRNLKAMGIVTAGGQESLKGRIIRMAHYHDFNWPEISLALGSLYAALDEAHRRHVGNFMETALSTWEGKRQ